MPAILSSPSSTPSPLYISISHLLDHRVNPPHPSSYRNCPATGPPTAAILFAPGPSSTEIQNHPRSQILWRFWHLAASSCIEPSHQDVQPQRLSAASARVLLGKCLLVIQRCFSIGEEEARRMRTCETACGSVRAGAVSRLKGICKSPFWGGRRKSKLFTGEGPLFVCVRFRVRVRIVYHSRSRRGDGVELVD